MMLMRLLLAAAISAATALATYTKDFKLNTYWGQSGNGDTLGQYCMSEAIDYITLAFVNNSPEHGNGTNYPGMNFASHCAADVYVESDQNSKLLSGCTFIEDDIKTCQDLGKKVLLSIGGEYSASNDYSISSEEKGREFADFMFDAFGPFVNGYKGPRPFDKSETEHTCIDGFDFDIESEFEDQAPYIAMVNRLRERIEHCDKGMIITAAPQCPLSDQYFRMKAMLQAVKFDKIWIQFYNNPSCDASGNGLNYNDWLRFVENTPNKDSELFIGLPASPLAIDDGTGYVAPDAVQALICEYKDHKHFGGVMLWDASYAVKNSNSGKSYCESVAEVLHCDGCPGDVCMPGQPMSGSIISIYTAMPSTASSMESSSFVSGSNSGSATSAEDDDANRTHSSTAISSTSNSALSIPSSVISYTSSTTTTSETRLSSSSGVGSDHTTITVISIITHTVTSYTPTVSHPTSNSGSETMDSHSASRSADTEGTISSPEPLTDGHTISRTCPTSGFDFETSVNVAPSDPSLQGSSPTSSTGNRTLSQACAVGANFTDVTIVRTMSVYPVPKTDSAAARSETRLSHQEVFETIAVAEGKKLAVFWLGGLIVVCVLVARLDHVLGNM